MVLYGLEETGGEAKVGNHKSLRINNNKEVEAAEDLLDSKLFDNFFGKMFSEEKYGRKTRGIKKKIIKRE